MTKRNPSHRQGRVAAAAAAFALLAGAATAGAAPPPAPADLRVAGGGDNWQAENGFRLDWHNPDPAAVAAVRYRVTDLAGTVVIASRLPWETDRIVGIHLPAAGRYRAEVWLESAIGEEGPAAVVSLRFDDAPPGSIQLSLPDGWIGGVKEPLLRLTSPALPHPVSGIRGYAVAVASVPTHPCAARDSCTAAETDLIAGGNSMLLRDLREGTLQVRAVAVSGAGVASSQVAAGALRVDRAPPTVKIEGVPDGWAPGAVTVSASARDALSGMLAAGDGGPLTALAIDGRLPSMAPGELLSTTVAGEGRHHVVAYARDAAGNLGGGALATVRIDRTPPRLAFAAALDPADPELLSAQVSDDLSGPDPGRGWIGVRPRGSRRQFAPLPTDVVSGRLLARWDSDRYPPGLYEFRANGYDAAGNTGASQLRTDGAKLVLLAPLKQTVKLVAGFGGRRLVWHRCVRFELGRRCKREVIASYEQRPTTRTIPYGRRITISGVLATRTGGPLADQPLSVSEHLGDGSEPRRHELRTDGVGAFALRLAPGPGRRIEFAFGGNRTLAAAKARALALEVRTGVKMRTSAATAAIGGPPLVFSGAVEDPVAIPATGKSVELQFRLPGLPWTQFRTVRTDSRGRFRYRYRFSDDDSRGVRFGFRAFAPAEPGWPYEAAASRPVFVTGR